MNIEEKDINQVELSDFEKVAGKDALTIVLIYWQKDVCEDHTKWYQ